MKNERLKKMIDTLFNHYDRLSDMRLELSFYKIFGGVEMGGIVQRHLTQDEVIKLEELEIQTDTAWKEFSKTFDKYYEKSN